MATRMINAKTDFGAIGDGVADDTAAVLAALTAAINGPTLFFPPGTYNTPNWVSFDLTGSLALEGDRAELVFSTAPNNFVRLTAGQGSSMSVRGVSRNGIKFTGLGNRGVVVFEQNAGQAGHGDAFFDSVEIENSLMINDTNTDVEKVRSLIVRNCWIHDSPSGVKTYAMNIDTCIIDGNIIEDIQRADTGSNAGIWVGSIPNNDFNSSNVVITNNTIKNVSSGTTVANIAGIWAATDHCKINHNSILNVSGIDANDYIEVYGIYVKSRRGTINHNSLKNAGPDTCIVLKSELSEMVVDGNRVEWPLAHGHPTKAIEIEKDSICTNNLITGHFDVGIFMPGSPSVVANNMIVDNTSADGTMPGYQAQEMTGGIGGNNVHDCIIEGNLILNYTGNDTAATYNAIYVRSASGQHLGVDNVSIRGNVIRNFTKTISNPAFAYGIRFKQDASFDVGNVFIEGNVVDTVGRGIRVEYSSGGTIGIAHIRGNYLANCSDLNIVTGSWPGLDIKGNFIDSVLEPGLRVTLEDGSTTPSVAYATIVDAQNTSPTSITDLLDGVEYQEITMFVDANTTVVHGIPILLDGAVNFAPGAGGGVLVLIRDADVWKETGRGAF